MSELTKMTVQALRDLARKALGRGHSRFKTKSELIAALQSAEKRVTGAAEKAASRMKEATGRAAKAAGKMVETAKGKPGARAARAAKAAASKAPATAKATATATAKPGREQPAAQKRERKVPSAAAAKAPDAAAVKAPQVPAAAAEPDPEGHLVARIAGESAVRESPHAMTESAVARSEQAPVKGLRPEHAYDEQLGELPWSYGDDAFIALPRDPKTLFLYWDHAEHTLRAIWEGLDGGRPQLWIYAQRADGGWDRVRTLDFALESRSYYIHDLEPGRVYRAEIHVVDRAGRDKLLGGGSNAIGLPAAGPSPVIDDRFMRLEWGASLQRLLAQVRAGGAFPEELRAQFARLSDWGRFGAAGGGSAGGIGGAGGVGGKPGSAPSSPTSPFGPSGRGEGR